MELVIISPETTVPDEIKIVEAMFERGLRVYHVRKPTYCAKSMSRYLAQFSLRARERLTVHSHYELALRLGAGGVHFRTHDAWRESAGPVRHSGSVHDVSALTSVPDFVEYVFFSPLFESISKPGHVPKVPLAEVADAIRSVRVPVLALGGITPEHVYSLLRARFSGIATLGSIWMADDPLAQFECFQRKIDALDYSTSTALREVCL